MVAGELLEVEPEFSGDSLIAVRLMSHVGGDFETVERVSALYSTKYGPSSQPPKNRSSEPYRRLWRWRCLGSAEDGPRDTGERVTLMGMGGLFSYTDAEPTVLPSDRTSWSDRVRTVTLDFMGLTSDPTGPYDFVSFIVLRYTTRERGDQEARRDREREEQGRRAGEDSRERTRLQREAEAEAEMDGI